MGPDADQSSALCEHLYSKGHAAKPTLSGPKDMADEKTQHCGSPKTPRPPTPRQDLLQYRHGLLKCLSSSQERQNEKINTCFRQGKMKATARF